MKSNDEITIKEQFYPLFSLLYTVFALNRFSLGKRQLFTMILEKGYKNGRIWVRALGLAL